MKDYIERYVYDVTRRLPEKHREEVKKELRANINDMLGDNPSDEEIKQVLITLGAPRKLALNYREKQRYLISPEWMDDYLFVLKIVALIAGAVTFITALVTAILDPESVTSIEKIAESIGTIISNTAQSVMFSFAMVTFIFAMIENFHKSERNSEWNPEILPHLPKDTNVRIPARKALAGLIIGMIFGGLFLYIIFNNAFIIGWYDTDGTLTVTKPLFNESAIKPFLFPFVLSYAFMIGTSLFKLKERQWNLTVGIAYTVEKLFAAIIAILFLTQANLINPQFLSQVSSVLEYSASEIQHGIKTGLTVLCIIIVFGNTVDLIKIWFRILKNSNSNIEAA